MDEYPTVDSDDTEEWDFLIQSLADRIIWDHDYQMTAIQDAAPEQSEYARTVMGIAEDYFTWIPPDLKESEYNLYIDAIRGIVPTEFIPRLEDLSSDPDVPF